tara:strand:+ start:2472 stop:2648 length:177 start_codon:yes stop_codon:yes gene_type:complete
MPSSYKPSLADGNSHQRMTAIRVIDRAMGFQYEVMMEYGVDVNVVGVATGITWLIAEQ